MSLVTLSHLTSHLTNASLARLAITSTPFTTQLHALLLQLQKHGYVSTVAVAGPLPPPPSALSPVMSVHVPQNNAERDGVREADARVAGWGDGRVRGGGMGAVAGSTIGGGEEGEMQQQRPIMSKQAIEDHLESETVITQGNIATRRIWVGLKYYRGKRVLESMEMVSKPTRRVWMGCGDLEGLLRGEKRGYVRGLRGVGEGMFASTDRGVMEVRECVERRVGGMLLCRVNGV